MSRRHATEDWADAWRESAQQLFRLAVEDDLEEPEVCGELLGKLREIRASAHHAPDPVWRSLAQAVLDELWEGARLSIYGDLLATRTHIGTAKDLAGKLHALLLGTGRRFT